MKNHPTARLDIKHPIDDDAMEVEGRIEQGAETVDEDNDAQARLGACARTGLPQVPFDGAEEAL